MSDHYGVLGVGPQASAEELRRAYLKRARALHPDRHAAAGDHERAEAERAMQQVNEAWRVLGDPVARAAHDLRRTGPSSGPVRPAAGSRAHQQATSAWERASRPAPAPERSPRRADGVAPDPLPAGSPPLWAAVAAGAIPYVVLAVIGIGIFVITAFAGGSEPPTRVVTEEAVCVDIPASGVPVPVPCERPNDGQVLAEVGAGYACVEGRRYRIPGQDRALCLTDVAPGLVRPAGSVGQG